MIRDFGLRDINKDMMRNEQTQKLKENWVIEYVSNLKVEFYISADTFM